MQELIVKQLLQLPQEQETADLAIIVLKDKMSQILYPLLVNLDTIALEDQKFNILAIQVPINPQELKLVACLALQENSVIKVILQPIKIAPRVPTAQQAPDMELNSYARKEHTLTVQAMTPFQTAFLAPQVTIVILLELRPIHYKLQLGITRPILELQSLIQPQLLVSKVNAPLGNIVLKELEHLMIVRQEHTKTNGVQSLLMNACHVLLGIIATLQEKLQLN